MSLITHAKKEMERMWPEQDVMQDIAKANVLELLEVFSNQGHSGRSAPYVLADCKPLGQLTGEDSEWVEVGNIFRDQNGYSRVKVEFPWTMPESKVIDVFVKE